MSQLPLFAFGTLRRGKVNHDILAGAFERCLPATLRDFRRAVAPHGFPAILRCPLARVEGELFFIRPEVFDETLRHCDQLEELLPGQLVGQFYRRMEVTVETAEGEHTAWVYADANVV
jgi:gamma-glutamylcyclotransferase (GGCT)/AIG2-like uncharacterized protein YtfP